jgi:hypothetical protein
MRTAQQMKNLMPESVVEAILTEFEKSAVDAAKRGANSVRLYGIIDRAGWPASHEIHQYVYEKKPTDLMKKVESRLIESGYKVKALYQELQFVDMDIIVSWGDTN